MNPIGPRMHPNDGRVVSNFIVQALKGEPITLYGTGSQSRSFCYVDDLVTGMIAMMDQDDPVHPRSSCKNAPFRGRSHIRPWRHGTCSHRMKILSTGWTDR